jgi:hypothetical protein
MFVVLLQKQKPRREGIHFAPARAGILDADQKRLLAASRTVVDDP